jgi:hypothetical protein
LIENAIGSAGRWFLDSGICDGSGGVARYFRADLGQNARISHEITGYALSAFAFLSEVTGAQAYAEAADRTAAYLVREAWDESTSCFPFEPCDGGVGFGYFFDCGIIGRALIAQWKKTGDDRLMEAAQANALSMAFDYLGEGEFHPVIELPDKQPVAREARWSRQPGCYQLKSALAWRDLAEATGEPQPRAMFDQMLAFSLATHETFLPGDADPEKVMDRLHAYCYFLEALLFEAGRAEVRAALEAGIARVAGLLREIAPVFARSDVYAQLLRVRLWAAELGVALDSTAAEEEAHAAAAFQAVSDDVRVNGGFWFGRRRGEIAPFVNPVSTAFCLQALWMWEQYRSGGALPAVSSLI